MTIYSYSRVNTFFTCPAQFRFRYIEKTPSPVAEGVELFLGSRFHETMEHLYQQLDQRIPTVNQLMEFFETHWKNHWEQSLLKQKQKNFEQTLRIVRPGQTVDDFFQKGRLFLENYYHQYHPFDQDKTEGIELKVAFNLDAKGEFKMQGFIDRLGRDDEGVLWIHDYKTSSRKLSQEDARNEDQLALYQAGLEQDPRFGPKEKFKLIWHFVAFEKDQVVAERNPREMGWLKDKYISKIQTIEKAKSYPTKPGVLCSWCEYLTLCADGRKWTENKKGREKPETEVAPVSTKDVFKASVSYPASSAEPGLGQALPTSAQEKKARKPSKSVVSPDQLPLFQ